MLQLAEISQPILDLVPTRNGTRYRLPQQVSEDSKQFRLS
jgi:hypothetical protein